mmetsp:Transcript_48081/g.120391  ORF Transcript_48081/g.120391 Transcript_48081/m.120391 type:complete len:219 (+) Transcript_48081:251-907(+)
MAARQHNKKTDPQGKSAANKQGQARLRHVCLPFAHIIHHLSPLTHTRADKQAGGKQGTIGHMETARLLCLSRSPISHICSVGHLLGLGLLLFDRLELGMSPAVPLQRDYHVPHQRQIRTHVILAAHVFEVFIDELVDGVVFRHDLCLLLLLLAREPRVPLGMLRQQLTQQSLVFLMEVDVLLCRPLILDDLCGLPHTAYSGRQPPRRRLTASRKQKTH